MNSLGDFAEDSVVKIFFTSHDATGAPVAPSSGFEAADVVIYKDDSSSQKTTTNGLTMTSAFDSVVGLHQLLIDTSNDTGDSGFWQAGHDYSIILAPDETVDGVAVTQALAQFSIENRNIKANVTHFGGTAGTFNSGRPEVNATHWGGTAVASANVRANLQQILGTALNDTGTAANFGTSLADNFSIVFGETLNSGGTSVSFTKLSELDSELATVDTVVDAIKAKTDNLPASPASSTDAATALTNYDPPTKAELDAAAALLATQASVDIIDGNVDAILVDTGTTLQGEVDDIQARLPAALVSGRIAASLDMTQAVPVSNTANTVGDCLNVARAQGVGKWSLDSNTRILTLYSSDGTTAVGSLLIGPDLTSPLTRTPQ